MYITAPTVSELRCLSSRSPRPSHCFLPPPPQGPIPALNPRSTRGAGKRRFVPPKPLATLRKETWHLNLLLLRRSPCGRFFPRGAPDLLPERGAGSSRLH